jgi:hypothetical protein
VLLEVTSLETALTGNDVIRSHVTGSMFCAFPEVHSRASFLTIVVVQNVPLLMTGSSMYHFIHLTLSIVVVQNVPLLMTGSSMANGCDVTESDITGIDATGIRRLKVGDSPWRAIVFVRGV